MLDVMRKEVGGCDCLNSLQLCHLPGGGTGSGVRTSEVEADWRGLADYLVKFQTQGVLKLTMRELDILRTVEELLTLNSQIQRKFPFSVPDLLVFPETFSIDSLNASMCS